MLTTYLKTPRTLEHYRSGLAGPHLDAFTGWLEAQRYQSRRIRQLFLHDAHQIALTNPSAHVFVAIPFLRQIRLAAVKLSGVLYRIVK